ncbi:MAG: YbgF trimerization domain-containing protein, partial [Mesorhizobium sp.]
MAGRASDQPEILLAQSSDARVVGLEEQVRQLNGRIEEMNFQILQIQEQMRKMQEDVDFRLQEVEQKRGDAGQASG